jgi:hypothetical protein
MIVRLVFGLGWSLLTGLAGAWLVMAPWTLGDQNGGDWNVVTKTEFGTGLGLIALAVAGLLVVAVQVVGALRDAGVVSQARSSARGDSAASASPEMEKALIALAQALADDLDSQRGSAGGSRPPEPAGQGWRQP